MDFKEAYKLPIGKDVEKKGRFSYLSWAYAVRHLRENFPDATWVIGENAEGTPVFFVGETAMVKVTVVVNDKEYTQWHPVLNNQNKPVINPAVFDINTAIQRCLAKAIGLATGIGLALYAGEDLPTEDSQDKVISAKEKEFQEQQVIGWKDVVDEIPDVETCREWWAKYGNDVISDCGAAGAAKVKEHWVNVGTVLSKKNG